MKLHKDVEKFIGGIFGQTERFVQEPHSETSQKMTFFGVISVPEKEWP
jgi:hypothetical protein